MTQLADGNPKNIILMVAIITYKLTCPSKRKKRGNVIFYNANLDGTSFLMNPELLLKNEIGASFREMAEYVGLASYRSYGDYAMNGTLTLPVYHNNMERDKIERNPLLHIKNDNIHFKLEETINGN